MDDCVREILKNLEIDLKPSNARLLTWRDRYEEVLYPGAHIATGEEGCGNQYHHGIVLDNRGEIKIVHFWGADKTTARIQTTTLACFLVGSPEWVGKASRPLYLISYDNDDEQKRQITIERGEQLLKESDEHIYNLLSANCECLAAYCRTGIWTSEQVQKVMKAIVWLIQKITPTVIGTVNSSLNGSVKIRTSFLS